MKMIFNDQQGCIDSIAKVLERTAAWRKAIAVNFPDDPRNLRAAETLDKLAVDANNLSDEQWSDLRPHFSGWASETWRNGLSQAARSVGFHHRAKDFNFFAKADGLPDGRTFFRKAVAVRRGKAANNGSRQAQ